MLDAVAKAFLFGGDETMKGTAAVLGWSLERVQRVGRELAALGLIEPSKGGFS